MFKFNSIKQLTLMLNKHKFIKQITSASFTEEKLSNFLSNHFTIFVGKLVFGSSRVELHEKIDAIRGDRQDGWEDGEELECVDFRLDYEIDEYEESLAIEQSETAQYLSSRDF